jgi:hypothetical protein
MSNGDKAVDQSPVSSQVPVLPVAGVANKELGPVGVSEIKPSGPEAKHEIGPELQKLGVQETKNAPDLPFEHKQIGMEHSGATVPVPSGPTGLVQIPGEKNIDNSSTWRNVLTEKVQKVGELLGV